MARESSGTASQPALLVQSVGPSTSAPDIILQHLYSCIGIGSFSRSGAFFGAWRQQENQDFRHSLRLGFDGEAPGVVRFASALHFSAFAPSICGRNINCYQVDVLVLHSCVCWWLRQIL